MLRLLCFTFLVATSAEAATNLQESFQSALKSSETFADREKLVDEAEARYSQAKGSLLPNITGNASYTIQDTPADPLAEAFFPRTQPEVKLTVRQPLFRGLREYAALRQYGRLSDAEKHARDHATLLLYNDVAQTYHAVLAAEEDLKNIRDQLKLYDERIGELGQRVRAGTSSETDLLTLKASHAMVRSQLDAAQASLTAARESFALVTGLPRDTALAPVTNDPPKPGPIAEYLEKATKRPDVLSMTERVDAADDQVGIARGGHLPTIDLVGNYYFKRQSAVYEGIDWDVQAAVSLPIFSGGVVAAQVRESSLQRDRAELALNRLRRQAEASIRTLHSGYVAGLETIQSLEQSLGLAERNYQLLRRDFGRGLSRNLDVLQALIASHETRRALLRARYSARDTWVQLNTAAGNRPTL